MRTVLVCTSLLLAWPALAQAPMNNVSRTITENAVQSTTDSVGKATSSEQQQAEAAKIRAAEKAEKPVEGMAAPPPALVPPPK